MKNFKVVFTAHTAASQFIMFESNKLTEAFDFFNKANFNQFFPTELHAMEDSEDYSQIELKKFTDGEIAEFEANEEGLKINQGWIIKGYSLPKKTFDIVFNNETSSNSCGFKQTLDYCEKYISMYNGTNTSYFEDYKGGIVSIICNETEETIFETEIK